jgi:hypothetical protein
VRWWCELFKGEVRMEEGGVASQWKEDNNVGACERGTTRKKMRVAAARG